MSSQGDWLDHARRHLDRAEMHRNAGGDNFIYARNELAGAISDIWTASREIEEETKDPRPVHFLGMADDDYSAKCGTWIIRRDDEWSRLTHVTTDPDLVTCVKCQAEMP